MTASDATKRDEINPTRNCPGEHAGRVGLNEITTEISSPPAYPSEPFRSPEWPLSSKGNTSLPQRLPYICTCRSAAVAISPLLFVQLLKVL